MKISNVGILIALMTWLPSISNGTTVKVYLRLPFDCGAAYEEAEQALKINCQEVTKKLESFTLDQCQLDGEDGSYVNYYAVTATGECL